MSRRSSHRGAAITRHVQLRDVRLTLVALAINTTATTPPTARTRDGCLSAYDGCLSAASGTARLLQAYYDVLLALAEAGNHVTVFVHEKGAAWFGDYVNASAARAATAAAAVGSVALASAPEWGHHRWTSPEDAGESARVAASRITIVAVHTNEVRH